MTEPRPLFAVPRDDKGCPDLHALVERAGRRHAGSIGETYVENPLKRPAHQGGWQHITPGEWRAWDAAATEWQQTRRDRLERDREISKRSPAPMLREHRDKEQTKWWK